jgi:hypothetical protein
VRAIQCSPWTLLVVAILADAAPSPSCGGSRVNDGYLQIGVSDCACAPGAIQVSLDRREIGEITCGWTNAITVTAGSGSHLVAATSAHGSWPEQSYDVRGDRTTPVELGCPSVATSDPRSRS